MVRAARRMAPPTVQSRIDRLSHAAIISRPMEASSRLRLWPAQYRSPATPDGFESASVASTLPAVSVPANDAVGSTVSASAISTNRRAMRACALWRLVDGSRLQGIVNPSLDTRRISNRDPTCERSKRTSRLHFERSCRAIYFLRCKKCAMSSSVGLLMSKRSESQRRPMVTITHTTSAATLLTKPLMTRLT